MTNILISEDNLETIGAALAKVNGTAYAHTFCSNDILKLAQEAEKKAMALASNKRILVGSRYVAISGKNLPKGYSYSRLVNRVTLLRRSRGWTIIELKKERTGIWIPAPALYLTQRASKKAIDDFRDTFRVLQD